MKKVLWIVLIVIVVLGTGTGLYFYQMSKIKLSVEEVLPQGALGFVRVSDIEPRLNDFKNTKIWTTINAIDFPVLMQKGGLTPQQIKQSGYTKAKEILTVLSEPNTNILLMKFFGQEVAVAFYPFEGKLDQNTHPEEMLSSLIFVSRLKPGAQIIESLSNLSQEFGNSIQSTTQEYKKHKIVLLEVSKSSVKIPIGYTRAKDLLIFGFGARPAQMAIDVLNKEKLSMLDDQSFQSARAHFLPVSQTMGYGNLEFIFSTMIKEFMSIAASATSASNPTPEKQEEQDKIKKEMDLAMAKVAGFKALGYSFFSTPIEAHKLDVLFDKEKLDPSIRSMYSCPPQENKTLAFIPNSVMAYQWNNCLNFKTQWEELKKDLQKSYNEKSTGQSVDNVLASIEKNLNLSIEKDVLPAFGQEVGGFLEDINLEGPFPLPKLGLFVQVADQSSAQKVMNALTTNPGIVIQKENYKSVEIKYAGLSLGNFQPGYCFLNGYLLVATSRDILKEAIDAFNGTSPALPVTEGFKEVNVNSGLTDKNNAVLFVKLDYLFRRVEVISRWGVTQLETRVSKMRAFKKGMQERLEYSKKDLVQEQLDLKSLNADLASTKDQLKSLQAQGQDVTQTLTKIDHLEKQIDTKSDSIKRSQDDIEEADDNLKSLEDDKSNPELTKLYVESALIPILNALESYRSLGSRAVFNEGIVESTVFLKKAE